MKMLGNHGAITASYSQHARQRDRRPESIGGMRTESAK